MTLVKDGEADVIQDHGDKDRNYHNRILQLRKEIGLNSEYPTCTSEN